MKSCSTLTRTALLTFLALTTFGIGIVLGDEKVSRKDVPSAVIAAFERAYPHATVKGYGSEKEGDKLFYEIESVEGKMTRDVLYNPDGTVVEVEESLAEGELPQAVTQSVKREYPKAVITKAERTTRGTVVTYDIRAKQEGKTFSITLDSNGQAPRPK
jgi:hypothetical protein